MSNQSIYAIVVLARSRETHGDSVGIEQARIMALLCGCTHVSEVMDCDWTGECSFIVGPSADTNSLDFHEAFMVELQRLSDRGRCGVEYAEIRFKSPLQVITVVRGACGSVLSKSPKT